MIGLSTTAGPRMSRLLQVGTYSATASRGTPNTGLQTDEHAACCRKRRARN